MPPCNPAVWTEYGASAFRSGFEGTLLARKPIRRAGRDLWQIFRAHREDLDLADLESLLDRKCALRDVAFQSLEDFFDSALIRLVRETWDPWLGPLVSELPAVEVVLEELRRALAQHIAAS